MKYPGVPTGNWRKSSYSGGGERNDCVEVATSPRRISIRNSKAPARATLSFPADVFACFVGAVKLGAPAG
ncbi:DUF397 domain-containing protein [Streptomyces sp. LRE541]|uniref:DUF397 domain-containing protein n=1 Tax=Streptomyces sp. LRE541 TaxID=2931983 RepID=UPI00200DDBFD|nr:DUF397 domain-containing protein [Streptomyces sp. LRE541]UPZ34211.1 DUF397 domain-containing protein [Streptomyces sp. LRE541]